jgi:hypothetical protein
MGDRRRGDLLINPAMDVAPSLQMDRIELAAGRAETAANAHGFIHVGAAALEAALGFGFELLFREDLAVIFHLIFDFDVLNFLARRVVPALDFDVVFIELVLGQIRILDPADQHKLWPGWT